MGLTTIVSKATTTGDSLRTTIPISIVKQFEIKEGDILGWEFKADNGNLIILVKPEQKK